MCNVLLMARMSKQAHARMHARMHARTHARTHAHTHAITHARTRDYLHGRLTRMSVFHENSPENLLTHQMTV